MSGRWNPMGVIGSRPHAGRIVWSRRGVIGLASNTSYVVMLLLTTILFLGIALILLLGRWRS